MRTSPVSEAEVGEPPDVAEPDGVSDHGEQEVQLAAPLLPASHLSPPRTSKLSNTSPLELLAPRLRGRQPVPALRVLKYMFELQYQRVDKYRYVDYSANVFT